LLQGIQLRLPAILNNSLDTYQSVATIITSVMNVLTYQKWAWQPPKFSSALRAPVAEPSFLDPQLTYDHLPQFCVSPATKAESTVLIMVRNTEDIAIFPTTLAVIALMLSCHYVKQDLQKSSVG